MRYAALAAAAGLVIAADAFVLIGVTRNRSAVVDQIELTERELQLRLGGDENSGVSVRIGFMDLGNDDPLSFTGVSNAQEAGWFNAAKLADVGFDVRAPLTDPSAEIKYRRTLPRDAFVVLEYGGAAWEAWITRREAEIAKLSTEAKLPHPYDPRLSTRLFSIDAGGDPVTLRRRYPDQAKYLIVKAVVRLVHQRRWDPKTSREIKPGYLRGYIQEIIPSEIHVPAPDAAGLKSLKPRAVGAPRYTVTLRYGSRYEPWVSAMRPM
jgi:hypothetical protein